MLSSIRNKSHLPALLFCFFLGGAFIFVFSHTTSPLYPDYYGGDSAHFMTVGMSWLQGKLPYIDLFDHKGPLIYFINMLGFAIAGGKSGIVPIQFVFMCFTVAAVYALSQKALKNPLYGILVVFLTLVALLNNYCDGNLVEEYCLPFLLWSSYGLFCWYSGERGEHDYRWAFLYGITMGVCFLTRITNFAPLGGGILIICIYLLVKGYVKSLFKNAAVFLVGFFLSIAPFMIYFALHGALAQMLYDILLFNIQYARGCPSWVMNASPYDWQHFLFNYAFYLAIFPLIILRAVRKDLLCCAALIVTAAVETRLFLNGFPFVQYPMVCLLQPTLLIIEITELFLHCSRRMRILPVMLAIGFGLRLAYTPVVRIPFTVQTYQNHHVVQTREWEPLIGNIPSEERTSFVAYGDNEFKELYPITGIAPCYKYYVIQDWLCPFDPNIQADMDRIYETGDAAWILKDRAYSRYKPVLDNNYYLYDKTQNFSLYRRMESTSRYPERKSIQCETNLAEYLRKLHEMTDVMAIFVVKDIQGYYLTEEIAELMENCGFTDTHSLLKHYPQYFIGMTANGNELMNLSGPAGAESAGIAFKGHRIEALSENLDFGNTASVRIDGAERAVNARGLNIVLMDLKTGTVFDSVAFDTHTPELTCTRID